MSEGEQVWKAIIDAAEVSEHTRRHWLEPCTVWRYEPGVKLVLDAKEADRAEGLKAYFTLALRQGRDQAAPGVKLVVTVRSRETEDGDGLATN